MVPQPTDPPNIVSSTSLDGPDRLQAIRWFERTGGFSSSLDRYARLAGAALNAPVALFSVVDDREQRFYAALGLADELAEERRTALTHSYCKYCKYVVQSGEPLVVDDSATDRRVTDHRVNEARGVAAYLGIPVRDAGGAVLGSLCAIDDQPRQWTPEQVALLGDIAVSLEAELASHRSRELLEAKLRTERREKNIFPSALPSAPGFTFAGAYLAPNRAQRVGGDIYDVVVRDDGAVGIVIADAVGHDLEATRAANQVRHAVGTLTMEGFPPGRVLKSVNRYLMGSGRQRLVTCAYVLIESETERALVASAGHPLPRLVSNGRVLSVGMLGDPLLGLQVHDYREQSFSFGATDAIVMFTDGLIERRDRPISRGEAWLESLLSRIEPPVEGSTFPAAADMVDEIVASMAGVDRDDDAAVVAVTRDPVSEASTGDSTRMEVRWAAAALNLQAARQSVREWLQRVDRAAVEPQVSLVVTELLSNAGAASEAADTVGLSAQKLARGVKISVTNVGPGFTPALSMPALDSERGRGLAIVRSLAESLLVESSDDSTTVTAIIGNQATPTIGVENPARRV